MRRNTRLSLSTSRSLILAVRQGTGSATRYCQCDKVLTVSRYVLTSVYLLYWWLSCIRICTMTVAKSNTSLEFIFPINDTCSITWNSHQSTIPAQSPETFTIQRHLLDHLKQSPTNDTCLITWNIHQPMTTRYALRSQAKVHHTIQYWQNRTSNDTKNPVRFYNVPNGSKLRLPCRC